MKLKFPKWAAISKLTHHHYPLTHKTNAYCVWFTVTVVHGNIQSCCHVGVSTWWKQADLSVPMFALVERGHGGASLSPWIFWNSPIKVCAIHHWKMNLQPQPLKTEAFLKKKNTDTANCYYYLCFTCKTWQNNGMQFMLILAERWSLN